MIKSVQPFLMFQENAADALALYARIIPGAVVGNQSAYGANEALSAGTLKLATLTLAGQQVAIHNSPRVHNFGFTPSFSFFLEMDSADAVGDLAAKLADGGKALMPAGAYGFSAQFAWIQDRFGVSWQLNAA